MDNDDDLLGPARTPSEQPENPLRQLILRACPPDPATGQRTIVRLARLMGLTDEALFKWIRQNRIPPVQAARIVDLAEGRVTIGDFSPFYLLENLDSD